MTPYVKDLVERIIATFVQGALGSLPVEVAFTDLHGLEAVGAAAVTGGVAAVLALLKGLAAKKVGSPNTAALLPVEDDTPRPEPHPRPYPH